MATFNLKPDKIRYNNSISTLDMKHKEKASFFEQKKKMLPLKKETLKKYKNEFRKLNEKKCLDNKEIKDKSNIQNKINDLEEEIYDIENNVSEMEYYSKVEDLLVSYYDLIDIKDTNEVVKSGEKKIKKKKKIK